MPHLNSPHACISLFLIESNYLSAHITCSFIASIIWLFSSAHPDSLELITSLTPESLAYFPEVSTEVTEAHRFWSDLRTDPLHLICQPALLITPQPPDSQGEFPPSPFRKKNPPVSPENPFHCTHRTLLTTPNLKGITKVTYWEILKWLINIDFVVLCL